MLKLQEREAEERRERSCAYMQKEARKWWKISGKDKGLLARAMESSLFQNYNAPGEPPTICWQHHKNKNKITV